MMPVREPLRSLIVVAAERAVRDVYIDGHRVVADGALTTIDLPAALERLEKGQRRMMGKVPKRDWNGRTTDQMAPMALETVDSL